LEDDDGRKYDESEASQTLETQEKQQGSCLDNWRGTYCVEEGTVVGHIHPSSMGEKKNKQNTTPKVQRKTNMTVS